MAERRRNLYFAVKYRKGRMHFLHMDKGKVVSIPYGIRFAERKICEKYIF